MTARSTLLWFKPPQGKKSECVVAWNSNEKICIIKCYFIVFGVLWSFTSISFKKLGSYHFTQTWSIRFCQTLEFILKIGEHGFLGYSHFPLGCFEDFSPEPAAVCPAQQWDSLRGVLRSLSFRQAWQDTVSGELTLPGAKLAVVRLLSYAVVHSIREEPRFSLEMPLFWKSLF